MKRKMFIGATVLAALLVAFSIGMLIAQNPAADYLSPDLRARVNQLKRDAETQPTTAQNVADRGVLLWQWINAYSLTGGPLPVNATQDLGGAFVLEDAKQSGAPPATAVNMNRLVTAVDELIYEFRIKDEHPKAIPVVTASSGGPFRVQLYDSDSNGYHRRDADADRRRVHDRAYAPERRRASANGRSRGR